jgi:hypothetical protein
MEKNGKEQWEYVSPKLKFHDFKQNKKYSLS